MYISHFQIKLHKRLLLHGKLTKYWGLLRQNRFCPNAMAHRFPIFDGLGSLFRENIYVVCDNMFMIFSYYVTFVCYYFSPSFIVINDNFYFKSFVGYSNVGRFVHNNNITA
jgi:hypothetical protein